MKVRQSFRGRPLMALLMVLGLWIGVRVVSWDVAIFAPGARAIPTLLADAGELEFPIADELAQEDADRPDAALNDERIESSAALSGAQPRAGVSRLPIAPPARQSYRAAQARGIDYPGGKHQPVPLASARHMLTMAVRQVPLPLGLAMPLSESAAASLRPEGHASARSRRWSGDGWVLLRQGGNVALNSGVVPATYGASQAGAVLRYRLKPENRHRPTAYLRGTAALNGSAEREAALGLSARPIADFPLIAAVEMRATAQSARTRLRPAAMVVTELPPFELPFRARGEAYAQAGYVGGRFATPFADGQLRVDRGVGGIGRARLRTGAGVWGGAQKGASRLDVGPTATMGMRLGESASARVAIDWRFRIAGDAAPSSGPALTLSAGF